jgi:hypothetical protein
LSFEDPRVLEYKEQVIEAIGSRRVLPIRPQQLSGCLVSIYGGEICCWQDGRVNSQLAVLGSSYRLIAVNSSHARLDRLRNYIGSKVDQSSIDTRFIFGSVGPISVFANAALFEYKTERAVSPHLSANAAAFAEDARIVLRPIGPDSIANDDSDFFTAGTRVHEATHVWQHGRSMSAGKHEVASWHDGIREDLCRFLQMPRRIDEIHKIFEPQFNPVELHELAKTPIPEEIKSDRLHWAEYAVPRIDHGYTLETDLQDMLKMRLIVKHADGRFYCPIFEKGKRWILV